MTKKQVTSIADLFYSTRELVGPCQAERVRWNELRLKLRESLIPEKYQETFENRCPQFKNL